MSLHFVIPPHRQNLFPVYTHTLHLACCLCRRAVPLENSKTDERGLAVHEDCYVLQLGLERMTRNRVLSATLPGLQGLSREEMR
jgi:hypothetical protein